MWDKLLLAIPALVVAELACSNTPEPAATTDGVEVTSATTTQTSVAGPTMTAVQTSASATVSTTSAASTTSSTLGSVGGASTTTSATTNVTAASATASSGGGAGGTGSTLPPGICDNEERDGDEVGVDCGGSCPACVVYETAAPDPEYVVESGCGTGLGSGDSFMCARSMVFSPEMIQAAFHDWGMDNPPFVYGVVGHDPDVGGVDDSSNTCCQCYQLVFESTGV